MAKCYFCGAETQLHECGRPTCVACSEKLESGKQLGRKPPAEEEQKEPHPTQQCA